ncbi:MAG: hypothetical protein NTW07_00815, partial [candidate division Zixibacteria bacterium]|nr:hypothetical protein [candidate division Zixibacteria bacterium]
HVDTIYMVQADTTSGGALIAILGLLVALAAVIIGPLVQNLIARKQTLLPMRQQWIENLRTAVADLVASLQIFQLKSADAAEKKLHVDLWDALEDIVAKRVRIELMLNPKEESHVELIRHMNRVQEEWAKRSGEREADEPGSVYRDMVDATIPVLKTEWDRIKSWKP